jgi:hypothetical protein
MLWLQVVLILLVGVSANHDFVVRCHHSMKDADLEWHLYSLGARPHYRTTAGNAKAALQM